MLREWQGRNGLEKIDSFARLLSAWLGSEGCFAPEGGVGRAEQAQNSP